MQITAQEQAIKFLRMGRQEIQWKGKGNEECGRPGCTTQISLQVPATGHIGRQPLCPTFGSTLAFVPRARPHWAVPCQRLSTAEAPGLGHFFPMQGSFNRQPSIQGFPSAWLRLSQESIAVRSSSYPSFFPFLSHFTNVKPDHILKVPSAFSCSFLLYPLQSLPISFSRI